MRCQEAFEAMSAKFDGELEPGEAARLALHLGDCAGCRAQEVEIAGLARRLRGAAAEQAPVPSLLESRIRRAVTLPPPARRRAPFVFGLAFLGATASFAALAMVARARPVTPSQLSAFAPTADDGSEGENEASRRCRLAEGASPMARACAEGGVAGAKLAMQDLVKQARARGFKLECRTCHRDGGAFDLREDARARLAELLAVSPT